MRAGHVPRSRVCLARSSVIALQPFACSLLPSSDVVGRYREQLYCVLLRRVALCYRHTLVFRPHGRVGGGLDGGRRVRPAFATDGKVTRSLLFEGRRGIWAPLHDSLDAPPDVGHGIDDQSHHQVCGVRVVRRYVGARV